MLRYAWDKFQYHPATHLHVCNVVPFIRVSPTNPCTHLWPSPIRGQYPAHQYQQLLHQLNRIWCDVQSTKFPLNCVVQPLLTTYPLGLNVPISTLVSKFSLCSSLIVTYQVAYPLKNKVIFHQTARQNAFWMESHQQFPVVNLFLLCSRMQFNLLMSFWDIYIYIYI